MKIIAGVDEVGRGSLIGPVYAAAVILNKSINKNDNSYDAVMCVGTFTFGHVKPQALDEFIRITKNKGLICFTIGQGYTP